MKHCILTVATLALNNTTPINLLSMVCCTEVFVMPLYHTPTSAYHMQANQKSLREMQRNIALLELTSIKNTYLLTFPFTVKCKESTSPWIDTSRRSLWHLGAWRKTSQLLVQCDTTAKAYQSS